jgi:hypothetical protein
MTTAPLPTKKLFEGGSNPTTRSVWTYLELIRHVYGGLADEVENEEEEWTEYVGWIAPPKEEETCFDGIVGMGRARLDELLSGMQMNLVRWRKLSRREMDGDETMRNWRAYAIVLSV